MKSSRLNPWDVFWLVLAALYFLLPLYGTAEFSLEAGHGHYGFDAYTQILQQQAFRDSFVLSLRIAVATVAISIVLMVPTVYWVNLKLPRMRAWLDIIAVLPFVVPPITLAIGILKLFQAGAQQTAGAASFFISRPSAWFLDGPQLLAVSYVVLALPFTYRSLDAGLRGIDLHTLTEAAQNLGAGWLTVLMRIILPNLRFAILSAAFLTITLVMGEYTMASLMLFNTFSVYMLQVGSEQAHPAAALAMISLVLTWAALLGILLVGRRTGRRDTQVAGTR
jgi:putative spermidine/putrescine transport system permease protein